MMLIFNEKVKPIYAGLVDGFKYSDAPTPCKTTHTLITKVRHEDAYETARVLNQLVNTMASFIGLTSPTFDGVGERIAKAVNEMELEQIEWIKTKEARCDGDADDTVSNFCDIMVYDEELNRPWMDSVYLLFVVDYCGSLLAHYLPLNSVLSKMRTRNTKKDDEDYQFAPILTEHFSDDEPFGRVKSSFDYDGWNNRFIYFQGFVDRVPTWVRKYGCLDNYKVGPQ